MSIEPVILERSEQPYLAIRETVTMQTIAEIADQFPDLFARVGERGIEVTGPPFLKYNLFTSSGLMEMEAGVPVPAGVEVSDDDGLLAGLLPGGRFASVTHYGHPKGLLEVTAALLDWGAEQGLTWDMSATDGGERWGMRLELYKTDPTVEPDLDRWETELVFRLADRPYVGPRVRPRAR
jgi:effector-binding domain-containing protein